MKLCRQTLEYFQRFNNDDNIIDKVNIENPIQYENYRRNKPVFRRIRKSNNYYYQLTNLLWSQHQEGLIHYRGLICHGS